MRYTVARTFVLILGLLTILFSLDAAMKSRIELSFVLAIAVVGAGYVVLMLALAERVLHGSPRERHTAAIATVIAGALPLVVLVPVLPALGGDHVAAATRGATAWMLFVMLWAWLGVHSREPERIVRPAHRFPAPLQAAAAVRRRIRFHRRQDEEP